MAITNCTSTDPNDICNVFTGIGIGFGNFLISIIPSVVYIVIVLGVISAVILLIMGIARMLAGSFHTSGMRYK